jgi:hypothetical protein
MSLGRRLWTVAPWWRATLILALCATALAGLFPPQWHVPASVQNAIPLPASTYVPPPMGGNRPPPSVANGNPPSPMASVNQSPPSVAAPIRPVAPPATLPRSGGVKFGDTFSASFPFAGRTMPLPTGQWRVVASLPGMTPNGMATDLKALAREDADRLTGLVLLTGNEKATPSATGFRADGNCERSDINYTHVIRNEDFGEQDCQFIDFVAPESSAQPGTDGLMRAAIGDLKERRVKLPSVLIGAGFRFADRKDLLIAKFYFSPDAEGIAPSAKASWLDSDWNKYNLPQHADKQHYVDRLKVWLTRWETIMRAAWREGLAATVIAEHDRSLPN